MRRGFEAMMSSGRPCPRIAERFSEERIELGDDLYREGAPLCMDW